MRVAPRGEPQVRRIVLVGLGLTFLGIGVVATGSKELGGPIVAAGWAVLLFGVHAFGRLGREDGA